MNIDDILAAQDLLFEHLENAPENVSKQARVVRNAQCSVGSGIVTTIELHIGPPNRITLDVDAVRPDPQPTQPIPVTHCSLEVSVFANQHGKRTQQLDHHKFIPSRTPQGTVLWKEGNTLPNGEVVWTERGLSYTPEQLPSFALGLLRKHT